MKRFWVSLVGCLGIILLLNGCSTVHNNPSLNYHISNTASFQLPRRPCDNNFTTPFLLKFKWADRHGSLLVVEKCSSGLLTINGLTPTGLELFQISYNGENVQFEKKVNSGREIPVMEILFNSMAFRLPVSDLKENFPSTWIIQDDKQKRQIFDENGDLVETIFKSKKSGLLFVNIINHSFHYEIELQMLEKE